MNSLLKELQSKPIVPTNVICAGGGSRFIAELNMYGGSSSIISNCTYLSAKEYTDAFLGYEPKKYVSEQTALDLAMRGYMQQVQRMGTYDVQAIACTAKLATLNEREGREHIAYVGVQSKNSTYVHELRLPKVLRQEDLRYNEEDYLAEELFYILTDEMRPYNHFIEFGQKTIVLDELKVKYANRDYRTVYPGSFNPIHNKHLDIIRLAEKKYSRSVELLLSLENYGKTWTNYLDLEQRIKLIHNQNLNYVIIPSAMYFYEKMACYTNSVFIVGSDNLAALEKYYFDELVYVMTQNNNRLLIFPRDGFTISKDWRIFDLAEIYYDYVDDGTSSSKIRAALTN